MSRSKRSSPAYDDDRDPAEKLEEVREELEELEGEDLPMQDQIERGLAILRGER